MRQGPAVVVAVAVAVAALGCAACGGKSGTATTASKVVLHADLSGSAEVPGPGDPDGRGKATVTLDLEARRVCFDLSVSGIDPPTAAHVYGGPVGATGEIAATLDPPVHGSSKGCMDADGFLLGQIAANPPGFYVNVHTATFPDGAVRGQLGV